MIITVNGHKFTVGSAVTRWLQDYWYCTKCLLPHLFLGSLAVAVFSLAGRSIGLSAMVILLVVLVVREWHDIEAHIRNYPVRLRRAVTLIVFAAILYVPFFALYSQAFLTRTLLIVASAVLGALALCLFKCVFCWRPFVLDEHVCPDCGVSMDLTSHDYHPAWEETRVVGPGRMVRRSGGLKSIANFRCPNCGATRTNVH